MAQEFNPPPVSMEPAPKKTNTTLIIVIVIVALLLCCCCLVVILGWTFGDQILRGLGLSSSLINSILPI
jgi:hypothetical protein